MTEKEKMLKTLNAYAFAAYDWNLYLDTHPDEKEAIAMFQKMVKRARELSAEYEMKYGPLIADNSENTEFWQWIKNPWPWDNV